MLSIAGNTFALSPGVSSSFLAVGGTAPYIYSVLPGGVGGTIASNGVYTTPMAYGEDTIQVTDSLGNQADAIVSVNTALLLVCDIIQTYMGLSQGQVYLWDQKIFIPTDSRLYIAIGISNCKPFGNNNYMDANNNSNQAVNMLATLDINILSRSTLALNLKEQVILALYSNYAQQQMGLNSFNLGRVSTGFVNLSQLDGPAIPYRFAISVALQYFVPSIQSIEYYNSFTIQEYENP
jgi:hypothetical protein